MRKFKILVLLFISSLFVNCAATYSKINPKTIYYQSKNSLETVTLEYKYDLLNKKYKKKELKNNIKLVAIKLTNNSEKDYVFGNDMNLVYENGNSVLILDTDLTFKTIKQSPASYLWYLLLFPMQFNKTTTNPSTGKPEVESSFPIGLILAPAIAGGNLLMANSANENLKKELLEYNLIGKTIKKGETAFGLIGLKSTGYESLKLRIQ